MKWFIFYGSVKFAQEQGDPCLGELEASTKENAEKYANKLGLGIIGKKLHAVEVEEYKKNLEFFSEEEDEVS